jgi:hypothetical protein
MTRFAINRGPNGSEHVLLVRLGPIGLDQNFVAAPTAVHLVIVQYCDDVAVELIAVRVSVPMSWEL